MQASLCRFLFFCSFHSLLERPPLLPTNIQWGFHKTIQGARRREMHKSWPGAEIPILLSRYHGGVGALANWLSHEVTITARIVTRHPPFNLSLCRTSWPSRLGQFGTWPVFICCSVTGDHRNLNKLESLFFLWPLTSPIIFSKCFSIFPLAFEYFESLSFLDIPHYRPCTSTGRKS